MTRSRGCRRRLTPAERQQVWRAWRAGTSLAAISAGLAVSPSGVYGEITARGGIAPAPRQRAARALSRLERQLLAQWRVGRPTGLGIREGARRLGRAPSTISREIRRNGARTATTWHYEAATADARAWQRARRPKPCVLATRPALCAVVAAQLRADWSPQQISAWRRMSYPQDPAMQVSAETIYRSLYVQARGVLRRELTAHLRRGHSTRRGRGRAPTARPGAIVDGLPIATRPPEVTDRAGPGH